MPRQACAPLLLAAVLLALAVQSTSGQAASVPELDAATVTALMAQKEAITNWAEFSAANVIKGWNASSPACTWTGVTCNLKAQNVTTFILDLQCLKQDPGDEGVGQGLCNLKARGKLAPELAGISTLMRLFLNGHALSGSLPTSWSSAGAFPSLIEMWLEDNQLTGPLPSSWGSSDVIPKLRFMSLGYNMFSGQVPDAWGSNGTFPSLEIILLRNNPLSGTLPSQWASIGAFPKLEAIGIFDTDVTGTLPPSWGTKDAFPALVYMQLYRNKLSGSLPPQWGTPGAFPKLNRLELDSNSITGSLPEAWAAPGAFQSLFELWIPSNPLLTGSLPSSWAGADSFPNLGVLRLESTGVSGSLPDSWGSIDGAFPYMVEMNLAMTNLNGTLPAAWGTPGAFPSLEILEIQTNGFEGSLPESWGGLPDTFPSLKTLDLSSCNLSGTLPPSWGVDSFQNLTTLHLASNLLTGSLPEVWGSVAAFPRLITLSVRGNTGLCGPAPPQDIQTWWPVIPACPTPDPPSSPDPVATVPPPVLNTAAASPNVGAIVGGVVGGVVVMALLAFFALRPTKGWLRKRLAKPDEKPAMSPAAIDSLMYDSEKGFKEFQNGTVKSSDRGSALVTPAKAGPASVPWMATPSASSRTHSLLSSGTDPILSFISSNLTALRQRQAAASNSSRTLQPLGSLSEDMQQWVVDWSDIVLDQPIGKGSYGWVYAAEWRLTPVACKVLLSSENLELSSLELPATVLAELLQEASVMAKMRHPNVVNFVGLCTVPACILTEYCHKGSLYGLLAGAAREPNMAAELTWKLRIHMAMDAARGLLYLHSMSPPIIHRDIKSPNLLVDKSFTVKVADFNLSKLMSPVATGNTSGGGANNPTWQAPEVLAGGRESTASDVYSFAMVLLELLTWELPWTGVGNHFLLARAVVNGERPELPALDALVGPHRPTEESYAVYCELVRECWDQDASIRPAFADIVGRLAGLAADLA